MILAACLCASSAQAELQGSSNTFYGLEAGVLTADDDDSATFVGRYAGFNNTTGAKNSFFGWAAGGGNTEGSNNTHIGYNAGSSGSGGDANTLIGAEAGMFSRGDNNIFVGYKAGAFNDNGYYNLFIGNSAGYANTSGDKNVFVGHNAGLNTYDGEKNTFLGYQAGYGNISGNFNVYQGFEAGYENVNGWHNVFIGENAGRNTHGSSNVLIGPWAGENLNNGASSTIHNTFIGTSTGRLNETGSSNVFIGSGAGYEHAEGSSNTFVGNRAGYSDTGGFYNVFLGNRAGYNNGNGISNVFIGYRAGYNEQGSSNKLFIANSDTSSPLIYGEFDTGQLTFNGDVDITGNLTKGSGSFVQPHPVDPSKEVVYAFFEGPEHAIFLRGKAQLVDGRATIETPEYFRVVAGKDEDITVQFTPRSTDTFGLAATKVSKNEIEVQELKGETHSYEFDYFITAKRAGFEDHNPIQENTHFSANNKRAEDFEKAYSDKDSLTIQAMRALLISNGILTEDGKLNQDTADKLGWKLVKP